MLETGDWLVPQFDYGVPFWGKPPLSTWLSAASMAAFGVNEFAARLPSLLLAARLRRARLRARRAARRAATGAVDARAVRGDRARVRRGRRRDDRPCARPRHDARDGRLLDRGPTGPTAAAARGRLRLLRGPRRRPAGEGTGRGSCSMFVPIGAWTLWTRSWRAAWERLPWVAGTLLTAALTVAVVLGRGARVARVPRLFPGRRALEALRRAGLEGRSLRGGPRAPARHDLAVLDRRRAALVDRRSAGLARRCRDAAARSPARARRRPVARLPAALDGRRRCCSSRCPATSS